MVIGVRNHVAHEMCFLVGSVRTEAADEGFFSGVDAQVGLQVFLLNGSEGAESARERPFSGVNPHVPLNMALAFAGVRANRALQEHFVATDITPGHLGWTFS